MQPSISIALMSIEMSSSISSCTFGCTCTHRQHGAEAPRTAAAAAAASKAEHRCRPARASGSCTRAPGARRPHSKSFNWQPAASPKRAQRPRQPPSLYPLSHVLYDNVLVEHWRRCTGSGRNWRIPAPHAALGAGTFYGDHMEGATWVTSEPQLFRQRQHRALTVQRQRRFQRLARAQLARAQ